MSQTPYNTPSSGFVSHFQNLDPSRKLPMPISLRPPYLFSLDNFEVVDHSDKAPSRDQERTLRNFIKKSKAEWTPLLELWQRDPWVRKIVMDFMLQQRQFRQIAQTGIPKLPTIRMAAGFGHSKQQSVNYGDLKAICDALDQVHTARPGLAFGGFGGPDDKGTVWMTFYTIHDSSTQLAPPAYIVWVHTDPSNPATIGPFDAELNPTSAGSAKELESNVMVMHEPEEDDLIDVEHSAVMVKQPGLEHDSGATIDGGTDTNAWDDWNCIEHVEAETWIDDAKQVLLAIFRGSGAGNVSWVGTGRYMI